MGAEIIALSKSFLPLVADPELIAATPESNGECDYSQG
jgi:hypothetical protein